MSSKQKRRDQHGKAAERRKLAAQKAARRRNLTTVMVAVAVIAAVGLLVFLQRRPNPEDTASPPTGVESFEVSSRKHVEGPVDYPQTPPVGGDHNPVWQNCGFYDQPIADVNGVHTMEHGAVWITYEPDLDQSEVETLGGFVPGGYVLVTPYPDLPTPVVASAWGKQLQMDSADDPDLDQFVRAFRNGPQTPEPGAPCTGGLGTPVG